MSIGSTLPPQAYTREILAVAFNWLQSQPESIRKLAVTPDALVGLYLRAQRYGQPEAPPSAQRFVSDLKNLAEGLRQFENPEDGEPRSGSVMTATEITQRSVHVESNQAPVPPPTAQAFGGDRPAQDFVDARASRTGAERTRAHESYSSNAVYGDRAREAERAEPRRSAGASHAPSNGVVLSDASQDMARDVRRQMNLSNESEAVNMMIAVAYKTLQNLLR